jgi:hypothetical protein
VYAFGVGKKPGAVSFWIGIGMLVVGLVFSFGVGALGMAPMLFVLAGVGLVVAGLTKRGRRAAGYACDECHRVIVVEYEAELCDKCVRPLHARCAKAHTDRHHPKGEGPYR